VISLASGRCAAPGFVAVVVAAGLALGLSGCSAVTYFWDVRSETESVKLAAAPDANNDFPVAVDLVAVKDPGFVKVLAQTKASAWFAQRGNFIQQNVEAIDVKHFELVPGQSISDIEYSYDDRRTYEAIFVFAGYRSASAHRVRIDSYAKPTVVLGPESLDVERGA
jgi:type VI secretion system protein